MCLIKSSRNQSYFICNIQKHCDGIFMNSKIINHHGEIFMSIRLVELYESSKTRSKKCPHKSCTLYTTRLPQLVLS